jgi:hypothetical protein
MAQAGYTPIQLYFSTTASAVPVNTNLANGELAININDGKLYYKDSGGVVRLLASNATSAPVLSFQTSLGGLTPSTATTGVVTLAGTLNTTSGGTGLTSFTAGDLPYYATGTALSKLGIGTAGQILTSTGSAPQWSTLSGVAVTSISFGTTGLTPNSATSGAVTVAGTLVVSNGGTGLTSLTAGRIPYGAGTSAFGNSANLFWDSSNNRLGVNTATPAVTAAFVGTDAMLLPVGTTAERPTGATGYLRFNTTTAAFEGYNGTAWTSVGGANVTNDTTTATALYPLFAAVTSGAATNVYTSNAKLLYTPSNGELQSAELYANNGVLTHANQVTTSYTVPTNANVITVGPWTVASGATFTLPSGSRQVLL